MNWLPPLPDLSPLDFLWDCLKSKVQLSQPFEDSPKFWFDCRGKKRLKTISLKNCNNWLVNTQLIYRIPENGSWFDLFCPPCICKRTNIFIFFLKCSVLTLIWLHGAYSEWRCAEHIQAFPTEGSGKTTPLNFRFVPS